MYTHYTLLFSLQGLLIGFPVDLVESKGLGREIYLKDLVYSV